MANNTQVLNPVAIGAPGDTIRTVDSGGVKTQVVYLAGVTDGGAHVQIPVTHEGHIEVAIHDPKTPFGSLLTEQTEPVFQFDAVYGTTSPEISTTTGHLTGGASSGTVTGANNLFKCSTGTTALSFATLQSRRRLRYKAGQGIVGRFSAMFSAPVANSILVAGLGTAEAGFFFGYNGTSFGILHSTGGVREIQTLTVSTASTATNNYQVTLNGVSHTVTATNNSSTVKTAWEIARGSYSGWKAMAIGSTVVFTADSAGSKSGSFSLAQSGAGTPAAGTFAETLAGAAATDTWVPQSEWNGDTLDGNGPSGFTLDPSRGNVFQIDVQYLGFGAVAMKVEVTNDDNNNPTFVPCHVFQFPNTRTTPHISQPSFPFTMAAYSAGSSTDVWVASASCGGFLVGQRKNLGPRFAYRRVTNNFVGSTPGTFYPLFTVLNKYTFNGRPNQSVIKLISMSVSTDDATPVSFVLLKDVLGNLTGTPSFANYSSSSVAAYDEAAATVTVTDNRQLTFSAELGQASGEIYAFADDVYLEPGESITVAAAAVTGTATYVNASLVTREDQ